MINIVTALACEANPIIQRYGLKRSPCTGGFPVYESDSLKLIISGMGKFASAAAVGYLQSSLQGDAAKTRRETAPHLWLNVGIAGHKTMALGTALLAHKISDPAAQLCFYPCFTFNVPCVTTQIITVDRTQTQYSDDAVYDMEALGFFAAAVRFTSCEQIHCLKIISDNESMSHEMVTKKLGEELVANQLSLVDVLLNEFQSIQEITDKMYTLPQEYHLLTHTFRFTVTQQNQLKRLLRRWQVLKSCLLSEELEITQFKNAKQLLTAIEVRLQSMEITC